MTIIPALFLFVSLAADSGWRAVSYRFEVRADTDSAYAAVGTVVYRDRAVARRGHAVLDRTVVFTSLRFTSTTTSQADSATGLPIAEEVHDGRRDMRFAFDGQRVRGVILYRDSATRVVDLTLPAAVYDFTDLSRLIGRLPLRDGYATTMPFFTYDDPSGIEVDTLRVVGTRTVGTGTGSVDVWVVRFADPVLVQTIWVDRRTGESLVQVGQFRGRGRGFRAVRDGVVVASAAEAAQGVEDGVLAGAADGDAGAVGEDGGEVAVA